MSESKKLTAVYLKVPSGYVGFVEEIPGANTQGATLEDTRENLKEAIQLVLETNRQLLEEATKGQEIIRESIKTSFQEPTRHKTMQNLILSI